MNRYDVVLDLDKSRAYRRYGPIVLRQGESEACQIAATIRDHDADISPDGLTPYLTAQLPSGDYYRQSGEWEDGVAVVTVDESRFASEVGRALLAYFELRDGGEVIATTQDFPLKTLADATGGGGVVEPYDSLIEDAVSRMNDGVEAMSNAVTKAQSDVADAIRQADSDIDGAIGRVDAALEEFAGSVTALTNEQIDELFGEAG